MKNWELEAVYIFPATVILGAAVGAGVAIATLEPPMKIAVGLGANMIGVPETVTVPPGVSVWLPIKKADWELAVIVEP